jgi:hypothetical protein
MTTLNFDRPFELKFLSEAGVFEGYASVFNVTDSVNDVIVPGAFKESLNKFHEMKRLPPLLWQHDSLEPIGAWREMYEDGHGLFVKGELFVNTIPLAKEAYKLLKENVVTGLSIGYRVRDSHRDKKNGVRVLTQVDLLEVSLVTFPANDQARVSGVKKRVDSELTPDIFCTALKEATTENLVALARYKSEGIKNPTHEIKELRLLVEYLDSALKAGFNPDQPRDCTKYNPNHKPAGSPEGGRFDNAPGGGSSSGGNKPGWGERIWQETFGSKPAVADELPKPKPFNANAAAQHAISNVANPVLHPYGNQQCGVKVREAAEAGLGFHIPKKDWEPSAKDQGRMYTKYGFKVETSSPAGGGYPPKGYHPQVGDIAVIQPIPGHPDGHAAIYTGKGTGWYSDFKQLRDIWSHREYEKVKPTYTIYRHPSLAN